MSARKMKAIRAAAGLLLASGALLISCVGVSFGVGGGVGRYVGGGTFVGAGMGVSVPLSDELRKVGPRLFMGFPRKLPRRKELYQRSPALAYGRGTHLLVWQEGWHGAGGQSDILAAALDERGRRLNRNAIAVCSAGGVQDSPDAAFCGGVFLVAWSDLRNGKDYDVYAALVDLNGRVRPPGGFLLAGGKGGQARPAVASDGAGTFLVVWQDFAAGKFFEIRGARVSAASGEVLDKQPIVCMPRGEEPDAVWTGKNFLVCQKWYGALVGADGKVTMPARRLWNTRSVLYPAATNAWGRAHVFMNTEPRHDPWGWGGNGAIIGVSVAPDGESPEAGWIGGKRASAAAKADGRIRNCLDAARWLNHPGWPEGMPGGFKNTQEGTWPSGRVAAAYNGRSILVAWNRAHIADKSRLRNRDIYLRRVTRGWSYPEREKIKIVAGPTDEVAPVLSAGKTGYALLAYEKLEAKGGVGIYYHIICEQEDKRGPRAAYTRRESPTKMTIVFDEPVDPASAEIAANYAIDGVAVKSAKFNAEGRALQREVRLETDPTTPGRAYRLRVTGVKDRSERGNPADGKAFKFLAKPGKSADGDYVPRWAIVGPFPHSWKANYLDVKRVRPSPGNVVEAKLDGAFKGEKKWQAAESRGGVILPVSKHYGEIKMATAYAHVYVFSDRSRGALLRVDATDGHRAWLNGRRVSFQDSMNKGRGLHDYTDEVKVRLGRGWNRLLVQHSNRFGRWQMAVQLTDAGRRPLRDLTWQLQSPFK